MISIFYGQPGAGKSFGALQSKLVDELIYGDRLIVTNLPVDLGRLNAWCQKNHPWWTEDINQRVRIVTEDDTATFYCFRTVGMPPLECPDREASLAGKHVAYQPGDKGVMYIIDEAHIKFDAREWKDAGPELTFYCSQHRKMNDDVTFITQHPDMLNNRLRMLAQQYWSFNNHGMEKLLTYFRKPSFFTVEIHRKMPTGLNPPPAEETRRYKLNKSLADCYDTSAGVGITGQRKPEQKAKGGINVLWILIPLLVGAYVLAKIPDGAAYGVSKMLEPGKIDKGKPDEAQGVPPSPMGGPTKPEHVATSAPVVTPLPVYVRSVAFSATDAVVTLTDGRILTMGTGLARITNDMVFLKDGTKYQRPRGFLRQGPAEPAPTQ